MTDHHPLAGNARARPSLKDCQNDAVQLAGCLEALDLMGSEMNPAYGNAIASVTVVALDLANKLANSLDRVEGAA
ncbi:hypothetical protein LX81_03825 [Palleronia aestuarii]|uniref:Uncharacterized protein n=1 Tax=Palleronia aestuarii TaxID=568105 RepID=A0A2W7MUP0_9RHOB|nr:hypothetical protein [Palleronia aestuarii]PZX11855.1 hypothetical protein LX81_03825 [Palleronia aestuarii]